MHPCQRLDTLVSKKCYLSDICPKSETLKLNFSMEKSKFAPIMLLYRFFLQLVLVSICAKYFENFPEIHLYFLEILVGKSLVTASDSFEENVLLREKFSDDCLKQLLRSVL